MKCNFCSVDVKAWNTDVMEHLVITIRENDKFHIHGPVYKRDHLIKFKEILDSYLNEFDKPTRILDRILAHTNESTLMEQKP